MDCGAVRTHWLTLVALPPSGVDGISGLPPQAATAAECATYAIDHSSACAMESWTMERRSPSTHVDTTD